ncbi:MAG: methyltransferase domain-containing protein [Actinomycetota bacterium]|nr:methyltransferase domain-containing protein [Actinomycetota bacterium]
MTALTIGCGPKTIEPGHVGLDINMTYARAARALSGRPAVIVGDASRLPFRSGVFGELQCWEVFEHIEAKEDAVAEFWRVAAPGAVLIFSTPLAHIERQLAWISRNYRTSVLETQHRSCLEPRKTLALVSAYFDVDRVWFDPEAFAFCLAASWLLDRNRVEFNDAGELVGDNATKVETSAKAFARHFAWAFKVVNRMFRYQATKSICLEAHRRSDAGATPPGKSGGQQPNMSLVSPAHGGADVNAE